MARQDSECLDNAKYVIFASGERVNFCGCGFYNEDTCDAGVRESDRDYSLYEYAGSNYPEL